MIERRAVTNNADWLQWRRGYLCASEIGAAIGIDPYTAPLSIYAQKAGLVQVTENGLMRRGRHFEAAAAAYLVEDRPGLRIINPHVFLMDNENHLGATPDRIAEEQGIPGLLNVQIKTIAKPSFEKWDGHPPPYYVLQVACENMLLDADRGLLACLVVSAYDAELVCFDVPRHEAAEEQIRLIGREFHANMQERKFPPPDYRRDGDVIKALYPNAEPTPPVDMSDDNRLAEILPKRAELKARVKADLDELDAIDNEIRAKLGTTETATLPGWRLTLKDITRKGYTVAENTFRQLTVKQTEGESK